MRFTNDPSLKFKSRVLGMTKLMEAGVPEPPYISDRLERVGMMFSVTVIGQKNCLARATPHTCGPIGGIHPKALDMD